MSERYFEYGGHWLIRRKDTPKFNIYWCKPGTRRVRRKSTHTEDLEQAKQRLIEFVHEKQRPSEQSPAHVSIHDALNEYVERTLDGKASQRKAFGILRRWCEFLCASEVSFVSEFTLDVQDRYIEWRRRELRRNGHDGLNSTIQRELTVLRAALKEFWRRGYLASVPYVRTLPQPPARSRYLTRDEFQRLYRECRESHLQLFVLTAIHTLQRPGAILGLRTGQVDLVQRKIDFLPAESVQSRKRKPVVPITESLHRPLEKAIGESRSGYVIEFKGKPIKSIRRSFNNARARAGLGPDVSPYTLRHTGATLLASVGVELRQIAGMLGHSELKTTEIYAKHAPEFLGGAREALDRLFAV